MDQHFPPFSLWNSWNKWAPSNFYQSSNDFQAIAAKLQGFSRKSWNSWKYLARPTAFSGHPCSPLKASCHVMSMFAASEGYVDYVVCTRGSKVSCIFIGSVFFGSGHKSRTFIFPPGRYLLSNSLCCDLFLHRQPGMGSTWFNGSAAGACNFTGLSLTSFFRFSFWVHSHIKTDPGICGPVSRLAALRSLIPDEWELWLKHWAGGNCCEARTKALRQNCPGHGSRSGLELALGECRACCAALRSGW